MTKLILFLTLATFASCASLMSKADFTEFSQTKYAARRSDDTIEILTTQPRKAYMELGLISCHDTDDKWNLEQAVIKARTVGADAIIITKKDHLTGETPLIGTPFHYGIEAVAIKYK